MHRRIHDARPFGVGDRDNRLRIFAVFLQDCSVHEKIKLPLPVLLGTILRHFAPRIIQRHVRNIFRASLAIFILIITLAFTASIDVLYAGLLSLGWQLALLVSLLLGIGIAAGWVFGLSSPQRITSALETGVQNSGLCLAAATMLSTDPASFSLSATPSVVYSALIYVLLFPFALWLSRRQPRARAF